MATNINYNTTELETALYNNTYLTQEECEIFAKFLEMKSFNALLKIAKALNNFAKGE